MIRSNSMFSGLRRIARPEQECDYLQNSQELGSSTTANHYCVAGTFRLLMNCRNRRHHWISFPNGTARLCWTLLVKRQPYVIENCMGLLTAIHGELLKRSWDAGLTCL